MNERVISYIDGFNLYFGLKSSNWRRYYWLNLQLLSQNLLKIDQSLILMKYFTSRVSYPQDKRKRQSTFIEALETLDDFRIFYGRYQSNPRQCRKCGYKEMVQSEKKSDVNIAVELLTDAYQNNFDTALLMSADADLTAAILAVKDLFPTKKVVIAFPPQRYSAELAKHAHGYFSIGRANLAKSVFPEVIQRADGFVLRCPPEWK